MKPDKPLKDAILRAPEATDEHKQSQQEQLYHLGEQQAVSSPSQQDLVNESHTNRMETFQNLREMEYVVDKKLRGKK